MDNVMLRLKNKFKISKDTQLGIKSEKFSKNIVDIHGEKNIVDLKEKSYIKDSRIKIVGNNNRLIISERVKFIGSELYFACDNGLIIIGKNTTSEGSRFICDEDNLSIKIGEDFMFSYETEIRNSDAHPIFLSGKRINFGKSIEIGNKVWLGFRSIILKGVSIGDNSIVGAGSLVTKSFGSNSLIGGNPAKLIKCDVSWER